MDNQFDNYELGNNELKRLLSSKDIDDAEKEELIKAFTAELAANPFGDVSEEDCHLLFNTVSIKYTDKKLTELMSRQNPTIYDDNQALSCCERLRGFIDYFASSGHPLPPITNKNPEACKAVIQKRRENASALSALTDNDRRIHELLLQAEKYPETGTCNKILDYLERLKNQINSCKANGITIPRLYCDNPKEITKTVKKLISIAEIRDNLYLTMKSVDEKITQQDTSGNYSKQFIERTISLCEQQNGYINQCVLNDYPIPDLVNKHPSGLIAKYKHYIIMIDLDSIITSELSDSNTIKRFSAIADDCDKQAENIKRCAKEKWKIPPLVNENPEQLKRNAQGETNVLLNALTENDRRTHGLLLQAEKFPEIDVCNQILTNLERLKKQINNCKMHGIIIPRLYCDNPQEIIKLVEKLRGTAEKRDSLYLKMKSVDDRITQQDTSGNYNKQFIETTISLCEQQNGYINQCVLNDYPVPVLVNKQPSGLIAKYKHYINMVDLDSKITSELSDAKTIRRYSVIADDCDKQAKNKNKCIKEKWKIPPLTNENPEQLKITAQSKIDALKRKKNFKLVIIGVALLVALVLTLVITITVKSHEGKSAFPFDPEYAKGQNIESVQKSLSDAGFTNIIPVSDKTGWDKDNTVLGISESYEKGTYYDSDKEIHIIFSSKGRKEVSDILKNWQTRKYSEIVSALKAAGFTDISVKKTGILNTAQTDMTAGLMLNGIEYHNGECYIPTSAPITVSYYVYQISIGNNSESFIGKDYKTVEKNLKDSGFNDVRTEEIKSGWAKDNTVVKLTVNGEEDYESNSTYDPNAKIVVQYSSSGRTNATSCFSDWQNTNYQKVKSNLDKAGFTNVNMIEKITDVPENDELISKITINNGTFSGGECYIQKDAPIYIDYYICKIKIGISPSEIKDKNYADLSAELRQKGFSNIKIKRADDMYHGFLGFGDWFGSWGTTEGNVKEFSIGGKTDFSEDDSFDFDDEIIITVHTYEDESYEGIEDNS